MSIHSATDHGFVRSPIVVHAGDTFRRNSAMGIYESRVARRHRDAGYWETVIISGGHPALVGSIQVVAETDILAAMLGG